MNERKSEKSENINPNYDYFKELIYFILSVCRGLISGLGWLFGVFVFGITIVLWVFGEFDTWYQIAVALAISTAIVALPGWITDFLCEGIMFLKMALKEFVA